MPVDPDAVGTTSEPVERSWTATDAMLYAVSVGCGIEELQFTTENSRGIDLRVLPTFATIIGGGRRGLNFGTFNPARLVHGEQSVTLARPIPVEGTVRNTGRVAEIWDKGSGAVVVFEGRSEDAATDELLFTTRSSVFIRGEGGFGGERGPSGPRNVPPERSPDQTVTYETRPDQALLYRLNGDRNPLHSDPEFAKQAGFDRPILHGLCTYGFTGRALLHAVCGSDPARFRSIEGRFSKPVWPADALTVRIWRVGPGEAVFQTSTQRDDVVLDQGRCIYEGDTSL